MKCSYSVGRSIKTKEDDYDVFDMPVLRMRGLERETSTGKRGKDDEGNTWRKEAKLQTSKVQDLIII